MLPQTFCAAHSCYYIHPQVQGVVEQSAAAASSIKPVILLSSQGGNLGSKSILERVLEFEAVDDVFSIDFMSDSLVVQSSAPIQTSPKDLRNLQTSLGSWTIDSVLSLANTEFGTHLPEGPYFLCGENLHQAWRLYPDELDCFSTATVPHDTRSADSKFTALTSLESDGIWKNVAVPSRLYTKHAENQPLAGKRISIKDNMRLKGVKATLSSRPYTELYGPDTETANFVQNLIDLGAIIVGKSKMSAFASAEEPTDQWVDFHAPFNPRGDGWQTPEGSTNGGAAALAGYSWLDFSVGTDTSGSIRYPAALCGLYALRGTFDVLPMDGIHASCRALDVVGLLGRDLKSIHHVAKVTSNRSLRDIHQFPKKILYPSDFFPYKDPQMQSMLEEFLSALENYLGVAKTTISISETWTKFPPDEAGGKSIQDFLAKTGIYPFYYDGYHEYDDFRKDYREKYGKDVYVGPYMRWKWETGSQVTKEQKSRSLHEMKIFKRWFGENILRQDSTTASDAILIMPLDTPAPDYRDTIHGKPGSLPGFSEGYIASLLGVPQLVLPIGQMWYDSRVSGRTEYHPITASLVGAKGSDLMLVNLASEVFKKAGWPDELLVGRNTFEVGKPPRNVADAGGKHKKL